MSADCSDTNPCQNKTERILMPFSIFDILSTFVLNLMLKCYFQLPDSSTDNNFKYESSKIEDKFNKSDH